MRLVSVNGKMLDLDNDADWSPSMEEIEACDERAFQGHVFDELASRGWLVIQTQPMSHGDPGFPDLVCIRGDRALVIELKTKKGRVSEEQHIWHDWALRNGNVPVHVIRNTRADWERLMGVAG